MSVCTNITTVDKLADGTDVLLVTIDDNVQAMWFYSFAKAAEFIGKDVIVDYRSDIYKGEMRTFISTFTLPTIVNTLERKDNIRLYCDQEDNNSNTCFDEIEVGDTKMGSVVYCVSQEYKSSPKAVWMELLIRDRRMRVATLRLFDYADKNVVLEGQYIMTSLTRNAYGFQSDLIKPVEGEVPPNPEISIAKQFIMNYFADDVVSLDYINKTSVLEVLEDMVDYERGYGLMRLAMELSMVDNLVNISKDLDHKAIGRALLASRGHLTRTSSLSSYVNNVNIALHYNWDNRTIVVPLLDVENENSPKEYSIMKSIKETVNTILEVRKGVQPAK